MVKFVDTWYTATIPECVIPKLANDLNNARVDKFGDSLCVMCVFGTTRVTIAASVTQTGTSVINVEIFDSTEGAVLEIWTKVEAALVNADMTRRRLQNPAVSDKL